MTSTQDDSEHASVLSLHTRERIMSGLNVELDNDELEQLERAEEETDRRIEMAPGAPLFTVASNGDGAVCGLGAGVAVLCLLACTLLFLGFAFFILPRIGNNGSCTQCPEGKEGPRGRIGPAGVGRQGDIGPTGGDGPPGPTGPAGQATNGICIVDPMGVCPPVTAPPGPPGPPGPSTSGSPGSPGTPAPPAIDGLAGANCYDDLPCTNCSVALCKGADGDTGATGPDGPPGSCDCAANVTTALLSVTGPANIQGVLTCDVPIDPGCIGDTACRDFSECNSTFNSLSSRTDFFLGGPDGLPGLGAATEVAGFGRYVGIGDPSLAWLIRAFYVYAADTIIAGRDLLELYSANIMRITADGAMLLSSGGTVVVMSGASAPIDISAGTSVSIASGPGVTSDVTITGTAGVNLFSATSINHYALTQTRFGASPSDIIAQADNQVTAECSTGALQPGQSFAVFNDLRISGQLVKESTNASGSYLRVGPFLEICGGFIRSATDTLTIQTDQSTQRLNILATLSTDSGGDPLIVDDPDGFDLRNETCLLNSATSVVTTCNGNDFLINGACTATAALQGDTVTGVTSMTSPSVTGGAVVLSGTDISGVTTITSPSVTFSGDVNCGGGSCTSDIRLKERVRDLDDAESLDIVCGMRTVTWFYKQWFCEAKGIDCATPYTGFIAQDLQKRHPQAVRAVNQTGLADEDGNAYPTVLTVKKEEATHLLVGAIRELRRQLDQEGLASTRELVRSAEKHADYVKRENQKLRDRVGRLEAKLSSIEDGVRRRLVAHDDDVFARATEIAQVMVSRYDAELTSLRESVKLLQSGELAQKRIQEQEDYLQRHRAVMRNQRLVEPDNRVDMPKLFTAEELERRHRQRQQQLEHFK